MAEKITLQKIRPNTHDRFSLEVRRKDNVTDGNVFVGSFTSVNSISNSFFVGKFILEGLLVGRQHKKIFSLTSLYPSVTNADRCCQKSDFRRYYRRF